MSSFCNSKYEAGSSSIQTCNLQGSKEEREFVEYYEGEGYSIEYLPISNSPIAYKERPIITRIIEWFKSLIVIGSFNIIGVFVAPFLHLYFDLVSSLLQTFIFTSLTIIFIGKELPQEE